MTTSFFRYTLGHSSFNGHDSSFDPTYKLDRAEKLDGEALLVSLERTLESAVLKEGFTPVSDDGRGQSNYCGLHIRVEQVWPFRGEELVLHVVDLESELESESWLKGLDGALDMVGQDMVVLVACRYSHNSGGSYGFQVLAVPRNSKLPEKSEDYHRDPFDREVNWMGGMDSNSEETVYLPKGSLIWNGKEWWPTTRIKYYY